MAYADNVDGPAVGRVPHGLDVAAAETEEASDTLGGQEGSDQLGHGHHLMV
jgi:hypothetical protein